MDFRFKNGKFTVLQVSDAQDLKYVRKTMLYMLDKAYERVNPDLIVLTGDNILGNHLRDARFGSKKVINTKEEENASMREAIDKLVAPIEKRKIPFAMIYGNHDDMNEHTKDEQADIYREYSCCVGLDNPDKTVDCDTYNIPIYSENGEKVAYNIWMLDSAWKDKELDKCFCAVKPETIAWYKKKSAELKEGNGGEVVPSIMFQHIPMAETLQFIEECDKSYKYAVEGENGKYFKLKDPNIGFMGEYPSIVTEPNGQLEAMKECGDVKAVVFGHDHQNCFFANIDGIDFIQTSAASFRCYGNKYRGVRVFTLYEDGRYETEFITYEDLCGKNIASGLRYVWDADGLQVAKGGLILGAAAAVIAPTVAIIRKLKK